MQEARRSVWSSVIIDGWTRHVHDGRPRVGMPTHLLALAPVRLIVRRAAQGLRQATCEAVAVCRAEARVCMHQEVTLPAASHLPAVLRTLWSPPPGVAAIRRGSEPRDLRPRRAERATMLARCSRRRATPSRCCGSRSTPAWPRPGSSANPRTARSSQAGCCGRDLRHELNRQEGAEAGQLYSQEQPPPVEDLHRHLHGMQFDSAGVASGAATQGGTCASSTSSASSTPSGPAAGAAEDSRPDRSESATPHQ